MGMEQPQRAAEVQGRLATVAGFGDLVAAMRGMAAARVQRARGLIEGVNTYAGTLAEAMAQALACLPEGQRGAAWPDWPGAAGAARRPQALCLVFGAEQGFNGGYAEQLLAAAQACGQEAATPRLLLLGRQTQRLAQARGLVFEAAAPLVAQAESALDASERIHALLLDTLARAPASAVEMVFAELGEGSHFSLRRLRLLPLEPAAPDGTARSAPLLHETPAQLLQGLAGQYLAARLAHAVLHSHACENLSRLQAMVAAQDNLARLREHLGAEERRLRQEAITAEVLELAAGLRAGSVEPPP